MKKFLSFFRGKEETCIPRSSGFHTPSPEMEAVYQQIIALADEGVWVPAVANGGLLQLLAEMEQRGWWIIPPTQ